MTTEGLVVLATITLPGVRPSVAHARRFVRDTVPYGHPVTDDMIAVASETVCNAITHTASGRAGGRVTLAIAAGNDVYRLQVTDDGAGGAHPYVKAENGTESGRGMRIVDALAHRWGYRTAGDRTVVWALFPARPALSPAHPDAHAI
jgi:anti-sigma regulatory factor (Ser/Thr protein kinase)